MAAAVTSTPTQPEDTRTGGPGGIPWKDVASSIINRHMTDDDVLDNQQLSLLKLFLSDENTSARQTALARGDFSHIPTNGYPAIPDEGPTGSPGGLVEYIIRRHGTEQQRLRDEELEQLRVWFREGGGEVNPRYPL